MIFGNAIHVIELVVFFSPAALSGRANGEHDFRTDRSFSAVNPAQIGSLFSIRGAGRIGSCSVFGSVVALKPHLRFIDVVMWKYSSNFIDVGLMVLKCV
jgi:hypothetical protein